MFEREVSIALLSPKCFRTEPPNRLLVLMLHLAQILPTNTFAQNPACLTQPKHEMLDRLSRTLKKKTHRYTECTDSGGHRDVIGDLHAGGGLAVRPGRAAPV